MSVEGYTLCCTIEWNYLAVPYILEQVRLHHDSSLGKLGNTINQRTIGLKTNCIGPSREAQDIPRRLPAPLTELSPTLQKLRPFTSVAGEKDTENRIWLLYDSLYPISRCLTCTIGIYVHRAESENAIYNPGKYRILRKV